MPSRGGGRRPPRVGITQPKKDQPMTNTPITGTVETLASAKTKDGREKAILSVMTETGLVEAYVFPKEMPMLEGVSVGDTLFVHGFVSNHGRYQPLGTVKALGIFKDLAAYTASREAAAERKAAWEASQAAMATEETAEAA